MLLCLVRWFKYISEAADNQKKSHSTMRPRVPVNKDKLTLADTSTDEAPVPQEKFTDSYTPDAIKTNMYVYYNGTAEGIWYLIRQMISLFLTYFCNADLSNINNYELRILILLLLAS